MNHDADTLAYLLFTSRARSRRQAKRMLREAGGRGTAAELDAVLRTIEQHPDRERIEHLADELTEAHHRAALAPEPGDVPLRQGRDHDEWIIGEGAESRRMYVIYIGADAAFIGEIFDGEGPPAPIDLEQYELDEGQTLGNILWLDDPPPKRERLDLFEVAREKLRAYDMMLDRDMDAP